MAHGLQTDKPVNFHVTAGTLTAVTEERIIDYFSVPADKPTMVEFVEQLEPNNYIRIDAERILRDFARHAYRRPVTDQDVQPLVARVQAKLDQEYSFEQAMRVGLKAVLVSPHFLFLREKPIAGRDATSQDGPARLAGRAVLDDFALASRLSYFLWSSMPDQESRWGITTCRITAKIPASWRS